MTQEEIISLIALSQIHGLGPIGIKNLIKVLGSATEVFKNRENLPDLVPGIHKRLINALDCPDAFKRAEKELNFIQKNHIECISVKEEIYPSRLLECDDAPAMLFFKGNANLNTRRVINMVGTRNATDYGKQICNRFINEIKEIDPDILIVSGLAYGIDIHAHRAALENNLNTVGVLAHGLDRIYPFAHRKTAIEMLASGGLLTEYISETTPDRQNFIRRNRIVAGMCDATIVIESAAKGGALITAEIANSYNRDCFAFPGRISDEYSAGCNKLIKENKATLIQSAEEFIKSMCWDTNEIAAKNSPIQRQLFFDLTEDEEKIVNVLQKEGEQQINMLIVNTNIPINKMSAILFELEMKGVVRTLAGGMYQLLN